MKTLLKFKLTMLGFCIPYIAFWLSGNEILARGEAQGETFWLSVFGAIMGACVDLSNNESRSKAGTSYEN